MRRPRQAEEKEVGLGREYGGARQGGEPAEQVVPAFPVPGAFPVCPGGGVCQHGLHRCRRKGIHVPGGQGLPQPLRERSGTDGKTAPDAGHAVKLGQGAQNHQVGKEGRFTEQRFRSLCVIHERFVNDPEDFGAALDNPVQGRCVQQAAGRIAGICQKNSASVCGLFLQTAKRREEGIPFLRPDGKNIRAVAQAGQPVFGKAGSGMTACLRFNARGRA